MLWNEGEAVGPTSHPKIMRAARPQIDAAWLDEALAELERLVDEGDTLGVVAKLGSMVREPSSAPGRRSRARRHAALMSQAVSRGTARGTVASVDPLDGLNPEQRRAAEAVRGPVCILAGAGSGKTTTITRRIAQQVATGAFAPTQIMAVTFTDKAAGELKARLAALGVRRRARLDVPLRGARGSCATSRPEQVGRILPSKALAAAPDRERRCRRRIKFRPAGDLATEIEWAKNRRITPERYRARGRRPRAADPGRPDAPRLPRVRAAEGRRTGGSTSRTCSS